MSQIVTCPPAGCKTILSSACVFYEGPTLLATGVNTNDSVEVIIQKFNDIFSGGGGLDLNTVTDYRSSFEIVDGKVYAGYLLNDVITITRTIDGNLESATNLTNLETDWTNRLSLTYVPV
jgi:hypothetical protein